MVFLWTTSGGCSLFDSFDCPIFGLLSELWLLLAVSLCLGRTDASCLFAGRNWWTIVVVCPCVRVY